MKLKKGYKRRQVYIFAICFLISASIWLLIKLSNVYDAEIQYPIEYINIPEKKVIVNNVDSNMIIHLKTTGFKLLEYRYLNKPKPVKIDLTRLNKLNNTDKGNYFLLTSLLQYGIQQQLGVKNQLISIKPDTLFFNFENSYSKKVPVKLKMDIGFKKQYAVYDSITVIPDSIVVSGSYEILKDIEYVETEKKSISNLSSNTEIILRLKNSYPSNLINFKEKTVKVSIPVEKYTESVMEFPVNLVNDNNNSSIKIFPDKVSITYLVAMKDFKSINKDEFTVIADFSKRKNNSMKINLLRYPKKVKITKIDPDQIEYLLMK